MTQLWYDMGFIRWPLTVSVLAVLVVSGLAVQGLFRPGAWGDARSKAWVDAVLFWGAFAAISGILGTVVGLVVAAQSIEMAGEVEPTLVWGGVKIALLSTALGLLILFVSSLAWFGLQFRWRLLVASDADEEVAL